MSDNPFKTPIVFIIFKRADVTEQAFEVIRQIKPKTLLVIADGPRSDRPGEAKKCAATRAIIDQVDWECEVLKNYSEVNLGCARRVSSGLNWVFEQVENAIILEDDCIPDYSFFPFCEELLERYRNDTRVMSIAGNNLQFGQNSTPYSYYFSRYNHCWGWATWRRAWQCFDFDMTLWSEAKSRRLLYDILLNTRAEKRWTELYQQTYDRLNDSWAYRWTFSCWMQSGLHIIPEVNLVSNVGFSAESTHTKSKKNRFANLKSGEVTFPLRHPPFLIRHVRADDHTQKTVFNVSDVVRFKGAIKNLLKGKY